MRPTTTWLAPTIIVRGGRRMVTRHTSQTRIQTHQVDCAHVLASHRFHANPNSISSPIVFIHF